MADEPFGGPQESRAQLAVPAPLPTSTGHARNAHERRRAAALLGLATPPPHGEARFKATEGEKRVAKGAHVLHLARLIGGRRRDRKQLLGRARGAHARRPRAEEAKKYLE